MLLRHPLPSVCRAAPRSVGRRIGVGGGGEADAAVASVENGVVALKEGVAVDEVKTLAAVGADVVDDQVDVTRAAANGTVERPLQGRVSSSVAARVEGCKSKRAHSPARSGR